MMLDHIEQQVVSLFKSHAPGLARICMVDNRLAGPCTHAVGIPNSVSAMFE